ncbi:hypothetical protein EYF80_062015 [Liparis tanakae]|uniref:Uncharacterized protein n=1 Tax=Liparis tanakae TaxID=230148 RepID=A0A4Z2EG14_9TELE|nr:hypothetical protein EYF80_062015 [Liparis tanakae]
MNEARNISSKAQPAWSKGTRCPPRRHNADGWNGELDCHSAGQKVKSLTTRRPTGLKRVWPDAGRQVSNAPCGGRVTFLCGSPSTAMNQTSQASRAENRRSGRRAAEAPLQDTHTLLWFNCDGPEVTSRSSLHTVDMRTRDGRGGTGTRDS